MLHAAYRQDGDDEQPVMLGSLEIVSAGRRSRTRAGALPEGG
jgi:hypothetical protein